MKAFIKRNFNRIITILFFALLAWYFSNNEEAFRELLRVPLWSVALLVVLKYIKMLFGGLFTKVILAAFDKKISLSEVNYLALISSMGNFFGPILGGAGIRAVYLKTKHDFNYSKFISTLYGHYIISFLISSFVGLVAVWVHYSMHGTDPGLSTIAAIFFGILTMNIAFMFIPSRFILKIVKKIQFLPHKIKESLINMAEGWGIITKDKRLMAKLFLLNALVLITATAEAGILFSVYVREFDLSSLVIYTVVGGLSFLVSFTPGAIGIKEAMFLFIAATIALSAEQVLQMAAVDRSAMVVMMVAAFAVIKLGKFEQKFKQQTQA